MYLCMFFYLPKHTRKHLEWYQRTKWLYIHICVPCILFSHTCTHNICLMWSSVDSLLYSCSFAFSLQPPLSASLSLSPLSHIRSLCLFRLHALNFPRLFILSSLCFMFSLSCSPSFSPSFSRVSFPGLKVNFGKWYIYIYIYVYTYIYVYIYICIYIYTYT